MSVNMSTYQYKDDSVFSEKQLTTNVMNCLNSTPKKLFKCKTLCVLGFICFAIYIIYYCTILDENTSVAHVSKSAPVNLTGNNSHVLCVLVPYRDRFDELVQFIPHMSRFLNRQSIKFHIAVINHLPTGGFRFNKGSTFNAGFHIISKKWPECDYIALHDIDTLPLAEEVSYAYPGDAAYHGIPPGYHPITIYSHPTYIGGILLMSNETFIRMNGFGNNFWGWGFEDIDFERRMKKYSVKLIRPKILATDRTNSFKHIHGETKTRDMLWCLDQAQAPNFRHRTDTTGLNNVDFTVISENEFTIDRFPFFVFNIVIKCNFAETPWCKPFCIDKPVKSLVDTILAENNANFNFDLSKDSPMWKFVSQLAQLSFKKKEDTFYDEKKEFRLTDSTSR